MQRINSSFRVLRCGCADATRSTNVLWSVRAMKRKLFSEDRPGTSSPFEDSKTLEKKGFDKEILLRDEGMMCVCVKLSHVKSGRSLFPVERCWLAEFLSKRTAQHNKNKWKLAPLPHSCHGSFVSNVCWLFFTQILSSVRTFTCQLRDVCFKLHDIDRFHHDLDVDESSTDKCLIFDLPSSLPLVDGG